VSDKLSCYVFDAEGLLHGYNARNLLTLEALHHMPAIVVGGAPAPAPAGPPFAGSGSQGDPLIIDTFPFTHAGDTSRSPQRGIDRYPSCDAGQDESGPEYVYRLELAAPTPLRMAVLDGAGVDIDLHLLGATPSPSTCLARHDRMIERTLPAGTYHLVLDTFVSAGKPLAGAYLLVVVRCEPQDPDCPQLPLLIGVQRAGAGTAMAGQGCSVADQMPMPISECSRPSSRCGRTISSL
jgi:hypothetical protein